MKIDGGKEDCRLKRLRQINTVQRAPLMLAGITDKTTMFLGTFAFLMTEGKRRFEENTVRQSEKNKKGEQRQKNS